MTVAVNDSCKERCIECKDLASGAPNPLAHCDMKMPEGVVQHTCCQLRYQFINSLVHLNSDC
jgi:ferric iron reductase protein FhuF